MKRLKTLPSKQINLLMQQIPQRMQQQVIKQPKLLSVPTKLWALTKLSMLPKTSQQMPKLMPQLMPQLTQQLMPHKLSKLMQQMFQRMQLLLLTIPQVFKKNET